MPFINNGANNIFFVYFFGIEFYPADVFSIKYRIEFVESIISLLINIPYREKFSANFHNDLSFSFNFLKKAFACPSIYVSIGYIYYYLNIFNEDYISNQHIIKTGCGININFINPYIILSNNQIGLGVLFVSGFAFINNDPNVFYGNYISIILSYNIKYNFFIYKNKSHKLITKERFQTR